MMKSGKDVLWSLDLFGSEGAPRAPAIKGLSGAAVAEAVAAFAPTADQEAAYLRYGRPILQILAAADGQAARLGHIRDVLADRDPGFDFDVLRTALGELERRQALRVADRDARSGDHLYGLTRAGLLLAG